MSDPVNIPVEIVDIINDIIKGASLTEAYALLVGAIPFLGWPIIGIFTTWIIGWIGAKIFAAIEKFASFTVIDMETISENTNYQNAVAALKAAQVSNDPQAVATALKNAKETLGKLIHMDGS